MISTMTLLYALLALVGGGLGAYVIKAKLSAGVYAATAGFIASCLVQIGGASAALAFGAFVVVTALVALLFKLKPLQVAVIVIATILVSMVGAFVIGFVGGFTEGFSHAFTHATKN